MKALIAAAILLASTLAASAQTIVTLDDFANDGPPTGELAGSSWVGNVTFTSLGDGTSITVGGSAKNDNGWGAVGLATPIDASGMNFIAISARLETGNAAPFFSIGFLDGGLNDQSFTIPTSLFQMGVMTTVEIPISSWGGLNPTDITDWNIGGGEASPGSAVFAMSFDSIALSSTSAVPESGTYATCAGLLALGGALWHRRRSRTA